MIETFTAEVAVADRSQAYERELESLAAGWFGSEVRCVALDVSMTSDFVSGTYLARGTFVPSRPPSRSRLESAAQWLGLTRAGGRSSQIGL